MQTDQILSPSRVVLGHCPQCGGVLIQLNEYGVWEPFHCGCGWVEHVDKNKPTIINRHRIERDFGVEVGGGITLRMPPVPRVETVDVDREVL